MGNEMGFTKLDNINADTRIFLDRTDILDDLEQHVLYYKEHAEFYKLFAFYGMGGIGKSRLVSQIYDRYNGTDLDVYKIPLEILNQETVPSILVFIRCMFTNAPNFDYVLFRYWDFYNFDRVNRENLGSFIKKSLCFIADKMDTILFDGNLRLESFIKTVIEAYELSVIPLKQKEIVSSLIQDKPENLYQYMVETLVKDIEHEMSNSYFLFIFDAYRLNNKENRFDWLKYFINTFHQGLFITTSRESLEWFKDENIDTTMCKNIPIDTIPPAIIRDYLLEHNFTKRQIDIILEKTDCVPLFVDIALNVSQNKEIDENTFIGFQNKEDLIKNFLSHLSKDEQIIIEYLSVVKLFNQEIYENVLCFNKLSFLNYCFFDFKQSAVIRYIEEYNGLYKIHSVLAKNIAHLMHVDIKQHIIKDYIFFVCSRIINNALIYDDAKYNLILNIYELIEKEFISVDQKISEQLLEMYFYLSDKNYDNDFSRFFEIPSKEENSPLKYIYQYICGKTTRLKNIVKGLRELESIPLDKCNFGKHIKSLQCDINYLLSISGHYNKAEKRMKEFMDNLEQNEVGERYYVKGYIYYCDMQMLRGKFKESVANLTELCNNVTGHKILYEIKKAIGHSYRFNFLIDKALSFYSESDVEYNKAYYYTVCCESECYFNPKNVLDIYFMAVDENKRYGNHNNLGKIYYSMAIVQILQKEYFSAQKYIKKAYDEFKHTQYAAGEIFVMITETYLKYSQEGIISSSTVKKVANRIKELNGIYEYLLLPIYVARKEQLKIAEFKNKFEWFSFDKTIENINKFIQQLKSE